MNIYNVVFLKEAEYKDANVSVYPFLNRSNAEDKVEEIYEKLQKEFNNELFSTREGGDIWAWNEDVHFSIEIHQEKVEE